MKSPLPGYTFRTFWEDLSGAFGDLGTTLPLAFAIAYFCHIPVERLFVLWGIAYLVTAAYYRIPVSIQPLKAMAVIAITIQAPLDLIATAAVVYGILFLIFSLSGLIVWLQRIFPIAIIRGIQLGIGLTLGFKALELVWNREILLGVPFDSPMLLLGMTTAVVAALWMVQIRRSIPIAPVLIIAGIAAALLMGTNPVVPASETLPLWTLTFPKWQLLIDALWILILPQLPLTIGNAVYAASDVCCTLWPRARQRATPRHLAFSIGALNTGIGLCGGFPVCHGAGGIAAHAQLGARSGMATAIIGSLLILTALIPPLRPFLFFVPIPILAALLLFDAGRMAWFFTLLDRRTDQIIAVLVGVSAFLFHNLTLAVILGWVVRLVLTRWKKEPETVQ